MLLPCQQQPAAAIAVRSLLVAGTRPKGGLMTDLAATAALTTAEMQCQGAGVRSVGRQLPLRSRVARQGARGSKGVGRVPNGGGA
eukprot:COSAG01_NODE_4156_length_5291_cov_4.177196_11_plen_84_part_01